MGYADCQSERARCAPSSSTYENSCLLLQIYSSRAERYITAHEGQAGAVCLEAIRRLSYGSSVIGPCSLTNFTRLIHYSGRRRCCHWPADCGLRRLDSIVFAVNKLHSIHVALFLHIFQHRQL